MMGRGKGTAKHPTMRRIPSHNKALLSPKCEADGGREAILAEHLCSFRCPRPPFPFSYSLSFGFLHIAFSSLFLLSCPSCSFSLSFPGFLFHFFSIPSLATCIVLYLCILSIPSSPLVDTPSPVASLLPNTTNS